MTQKFSPSISKELKYYVYIYSHPETHEIFYVGKGKGNRAFSHLEDTSESKKTAYIKQLRSQYLEPKIEILIHGIEDEKTALRVEASIIDLIGMEQLTNNQSGYKSKTFGRMSIEQIISTYEKKKIDIGVPSILIRINQAFRYSISPIELYDYTRGQWKLNLDRAGNAKYAFAVYQVIIQEVYEILNWYPANATFNVRTNLIDRKPEERIKGRYEFIGNLAKESIRAKYKYRSVEHYFKKGNSNPIMYVGV